MESRVLDMNSEALGVPGSQLMENAGKAIADALASSSEPGRILIVCGTGNNGGDGMVAARHLAQANWEVTIALVRSRSDIKGHLPRDNICRLPESVKLLENADPGIASDFPIILDAMLGTGLHSAPAEPYASWIVAINASGARIVSVDIPSGLGTILAVKPSETVTMHDVKVGMTKANSGKITVADIGIPSDAAEFTGPGDMIFYPIPRKDSHKGQNGHVLIIGGGPYFGAPALSGFAAHAVGVDLVTIASPESSASVIASYSPNFIVRTLPGKVLAPGNLKDLEPYIEDADAVLVGPGLGRAPETVEAVRDLLASLKKPIVVDADGLHALSVEAFPPFRIPAVLTPHSREFTKLGGSKQLNEEAVRFLADKYKTTVLLKRPVDIISDGQNVKKNRTGNPGMSVGGTGDVLAGMVTGLMAKGVPPYQAARMGAYMSGLSGDLAFDSLGFSMTATDVIACIPAVLSRGLRQL